MKLKTKLKAGIYIDIDAVEAGWNRLFGPKFDPPSNTAVC